MVTADLERHVEKKCGKCFAIRCINRWFSIRSSIVVSLVNPSKKTKEWWRLWVTLYFNVLKKINNKGGQIFFVTDFNKLRSQGDNMILITMLIYWNGFVWKGFVRWLKLVGWGNEDWDGILHPIHLYHRVQSPTIRVSINIFFSLKKLNKVNKK